MPIYAPTQLRTEYLADPIGLDVLLPRFSWQMRDDRRGARQTAYRIIATDADAAVSTVPLWDSGKTDGDTSTHVVYAGPELPSRRRIRWRVRVWNSDGVESPWSAAATLEMGLLDRADWLGEWIGPAEVCGPRTSPPCPCLRKSFVAAEKPVRARLYVAAIGLFEADINGTRVGADALSPGMSHSSKRVQNHVYDVTEQIAEGENAIGVIVADGLKSGHVGSDPRRVDGDPPRLLAQIELFYADGRGETIATDGTWRYTTSGPIRSSDPLMGEDYDARLNLGGWSSAGFDDALWRPAETFAAPAIELVARRSPPIRRIEERPMLPNPTKRGGKWIVDLGQTIVGRCRLRLRNMPAGQTIRLRYADVVDTDGSLYTDALRVAQATDTYTCRGDAIEEYEPRFTCHGFRYVEIAGVESLDTDTITGIVVHSGLPETGEFECSSPLLNPLHDVRPRSIHPTFSSFTWDDGPARSDATVIGPWTAYLSHGDVRLLIERYPTMQRFVENLEASSNAFIRTDWGQSSPDGGVWLSVNDDTPKDLIGTAFTAHCADLMAKIASVLGKLEDVQRYRKLGDDVRAAWQHRFVTPAGLIVGQTQSAYALALHFRLVPFQLRERVVAMLVHNIEARDMHLSTGSVGVPYLLGALAEAGRLDIAYALVNRATKEERPHGWTPDEQFNDAGTTTFDHYAYGAVDAWIYATIAGIDVDPSRPAYKHSILAPRPGGGLTFARGAIETMFGRLATEWHLDSGAFTLDVTIPPNTTATIHVPATSADVVREGDAPANGSPDLTFVAHRDGAAIYEAAAGTYRFTSSI